MTTTIYLFGLGLLLLFLACVYASLTHSVSRMRHTCFFEVVGAIALSKIVFFSELYKTQSPDATVVLWLSALAMAVSGLVIFMVRGRDVIRVSA